MASMCQPGTKGVDGSTTGHACWTNSPKLRVASSLSISSRREGLVSNVAKQSEFFIGQLRKVRPGCDLNRPTGQSAVLGVDDIAVAEQILREEDGGGDIVFGCHAKQAAPDRHSAL